MTPNYSAHFKFKDGKYLVAKVWEDEAIALFYGATYLDIQIIKTLERLERDGTSYLFDEEEARKQCSNQDVKALRVLDSEGYELKLEIVEDAMCLDDATRLARVMPSH